MKKELEKVEKELCELKVLIEKLIKML